MSENTLQTQSVKLKGRLFTLTVLQVMSPDINLFDQQLTETVARAPKLFERTPVVFDVSALHETDLDLQSFLQIARSHGMIPVAIQGATPFLETVAQCHQLAVLNASTSHDKPMIDHAEPQIQEWGTSKLVTTPVRSGQKILAKGCDLIVTSSVSHGAELLADGSIHVYGALRGRALAGLSGDLNARIFCQSLEAELVSIAGFYLLSDAIESVKGPCQIYLKDEQISIESL